MLRRGALSWVPNSEEDRVLSFLRTDSKEEMLIAVNLSNRPVKVLLALPTESDRPYSEITVIPGVTVAASKEPSVNLPFLAFEPWGVRVFAREQKK